MASVPSDFGMARRGIADRSVLIVGVGGGTASGKTSVCTIIQERLNTRRVEIISQDSFYRPLTAHERENVGSYNFDHPSAFDWDRIRTTLRDLKDGKSVEVPIYNFVTHSREEKTTQVYGVDVVIFEGILALFNKDVRTLFNMRLFVDTDPDIRLARRIRRDIAERGRDLEGVLQQYTRTVKPAFDEFVFPCKRFADVIIPRGADNEVAIDLVVTSLRLRLEQTKGTNDGSNGLTGGGGSGSGAGNGLLSTRFVRASSDGDDDDSGVLSDASSSSNKPLGSSTSGTDSLARALADDSTRTGVVIVDPAAGKGALDAWQEGGGEETQVTVLLE